MSSTRSPSRGVVRGVLLVGVLAGGLAWFALRNPFFGSKVHADFNGTLDRVEALVAGASFEEAEARLVDFEENLVAQREAGNVTAEEADYFLPRVEQARENVRGTRALAALEELLDPVRTAQAAEDWTQAGLLLKPARAFVRTQITAATVGERILGELERRVGEIEHDVRRHHDAEEVARLRERFEDVEDPYVRQELLKLLVRSADTSEGGREFLVESLRSAEAEIQDWAKRGDELVIRPARAGNVDQVLAGFRELEASGVPRGLIARLQNDVPTPPDVEGVEWVHVLSDSYRIGTPEDQTGRGSSEIEPRYVDLEKPFLISTTEVTQATFRGLFPRKEWTGVTGDDFPAHSVSFQEVLAFCERLSLLHPGYRFSPPSETEWEIAARGGSLAPFELPCFSPQSEHKERVQRGGESMEHALRAYAWFRSNSKRLQPVGQKLSNPLGMSDVHGNVYEWCLPDADVFGETPTAFFGHAPTRGGSYLSDFDACRVAARSWQREDRATATVGFRLTCRR